MIKVALTNIKNGLILAQPVYDILGGLLFPGGHTLNQTDVVTLQVWGIKEVVVEGEAATDSLENEILTEPSKVTSSELEQRIQRIEHRFSNLAGDEIMDRIKEIAIRQLRDQYGS